LGILTDFVIADRSEAKRVCDSDCPSKDFAGLDAKGIDHVKLGTLHAILAGVEFDPSFGSRMLCSRRADGPWVFEVPPDMVQRLAALTEPQLVSAGQKWAHTEEFSVEYDHWSVGAVQQVLRALAGLCKQACNEGRSVLMWMCL